MIIDKNDVLNVKDLGKGGDAEISIVEVPDGHKAAYAVKPAPVTRRWLCDFPNRTISKVEVVGESCEGLTDTPHTIGDEFYVEYETVVVPNHTPTINIRELIKMQWD